MSIYFGDPDGSDTAKVRSDQNSDGTPVFQDFRLNGPVIIFSESEEIDLENRYELCDASDSDPCESTTGSLACLEFFNKPDSSDGDGETEILHYCFYPVLDCADIPANALVEAPDDLKDEGDFINCEAYCEDSDCALSPESGESEGIAAEEVFDPLPPTKKPSELFDGAFDFSRDEFYFEPWFLLLAGCCLFCLILLLSGCIYYCCRNKDQKAPIHPSE